MPPRGKKAPSVSTTGSSGGENGSSVRGSSGRVTKGVNGDKKRTQNRTAQRCLRERRAASNRHMHTILDTVQFATEADKSKQYSILLNAQVNLIKENQQMEEALFRLRKKLLSISNTAAAAADDPIFDLMLGRQSRRDDGKDDGNTQEQNCEERPETPQNLGKSLGGDNSSIRSTSSSSGADQQFPIYDMDIAFPRDLTGLGDAADPTDGLSETYTFTNADNTAQFFLNEPLNAFSFAQPPGREQTHDLEGPIDELYDTSIVESASWVAPQPDGAVHTAGLTPSIPWDVYSLSPPTKLTLFSSVQFSKRMLMAAFNCVSRAEHTSLAKHLSSNQLAQMVAIAAVNMSAAYSGMQRYIYGVNGAAYMERILYWRLISGLRSIVPDPFRPTPLQCSSRSGAWGMVVDFLGWPEIRDQLLLTGNCIDMDAFTRDVILNTVMEIPAKGVAVNVFRQFEYSTSRTEQGEDQGQIPSLTPREKTPSHTTPRSAVDEGWVFFEIERGESDFHSWAADPIEEALTRRLWRRVLQLSRMKKEKQCDGGNDDDWLSASAPIESGLGRIDTTFSVDRTQFGSVLADTPSWKISKDMAAKYPFLDCSSVCTKFETVPFLAT